MAGVVRRSERQQTHKPPPAPSGTFSNIFFNKHPLGKIENRVLTPQNKDPNIFVVEKFLTETELNFLDAKILPSTFHQSFTDDGGGKRILDEERTSTFTTLDDSTATITKIKARAAQIVGMQPDLVEQLQIVRYLDQQKFNLHHDMCTIDDNNNVIEVGDPRRLVTFFIYLSTLPPDAEGETEFPELGLKIRPKRGDALLFCNILQDGSPDIRVVHQAREVLGGHTKLGINLWINDKMTISPSRTPAAVAPAHGQADSSPKAQTAPGQEEQSHAAGGRQRDQEEKTPAVARAREDRALHTRAKEPSGDPMTVTSEPRENGGSHAPAAGDAGRAHDMFQKFVSKMVWFIVRP